MRTCPEGSLQVELMVDRATAVAGHHTKPQLLEPRSTRSPHCRHAAELLHGCKPFLFFKNSSKSTDVALAVTTKQNHSNLQTIK